MTELERLANDVRELASKLEKLAQRAEKLGTVTPDVAEGVQWLWKWAAEIEDD